MMTSNISAFVLGAGLGAGVAFFVLKVIRQNRVIEKRTDPIYYKILSKKKENLIKIVDFLEKRRRVTNNDVETMLGVSDATAERYLDELEKEKILSQVGKTGRRVYYVLKK